MWPRTTLYYKASTKCFPVLLCTTKLAKKHFPALLCTTKLAQSASQHYFVLQSLHKALASTTLYYKACTKHVPVLLCTTKLAQSTSQYHFVLQSLHKALPSTTLYYTKVAQSTSLYALYYKACTKHFPVLLCTTKLAQSTSQYHSTVHGKTQGFMPRLPPQHMPHATFMQPLQCAVHPRIAEHQKEEPITLETIAAAPAAHTSCPCCSHFTRQNASSPTQVPCNIHAAITMRFAAHCTHPCVAEHHGRTDCSKRSQPHPPRTQAAFHRRLQPLYTEKHKVSCPGFLPNAASLPSVTSLRHHHFL